VPPFAQYFDPFVGGGAVFFALSPERALINDASRELMDFYRAVTAGDPQLHALLALLLGHWRFLSELVDESSARLLDSYSRRRQSHELHADDPVWEGIIQRAHHHATRTLLMLPTGHDSDYASHLWHRLRDKAHRMRRIEERRGELIQHDVVANLEAAMKSAFYVHCRALYNAREALALAPGLCAALFFFVRENAYASMFRYNRHGEFNVPYGGISYNRKDLQRKAAHLEHADVRNLLARTTVASQDFERFLASHRPAAEDFIFLDPPYHSDFSTYAGRAFGPREHRRLARYLLRRCRARFMLVIKRTEFIMDLYKDERLTIEAFDKKYLVSFQDRNDRNAQHLIIRNYTGTVSDCAR
jgi:DNA adenine methylase